MKPFKPYLLIALTALLAFAPVSFMLLSLKNDIIALEYPINYFISDSLRHGEWPAWFNTWGMGFPLQSNLTWGIFSTPRMLFSGLFEYDIYILHAEFIFYIMLAGWSMFYLLRRFFVKDEKLALLLSLCYMLSGFITGSSQWLLYITAASFIPMLISTVLHLLERPGIRYAVQFAVIYTLMFTSIYTAFSIVITWALLFFLAARIMLEKENRIRLIKYLGLAGGCTLVLCGPVLFYSLEVLEQLERGKAIAESGYFFNSNYLHPLSLQGLLFPFSYGKMNFPNTEGSMLNDYMGIFLLLMVPVMIARIWKTGDKKTWGLLAVSFLFLLLSFGGLLPLRNALNVLPGFAYFRNPALFRLFSMIALLMAIGNSFKNSSLDDVLNNPVIKRVLVFLLAISLVVLVIHAGSLGSIPTDSVTGMIRSINHSQALAISALIQLPILILLWLLLRFKKMRWITVLFAADLVVNTLACGIFFTVSSYTPAEVNRILKRAPGFPIQTISPSLVKATMVDRKSNIWQNVNVFSKTVSADSSYRGPLVLEEKKPGFENKPLVSAPFDSSALIRVILQRPSHIRVKLSCSQNTVITLAQNRYSGWKVLQDGREIYSYDRYDSRTLQQKQLFPEGISVMAAKGESTLDFVYERKTQMVFALLLHLIILSWLLWKLAGLRKINRSFYPS